MDRSVVAYTLRSDCRGNRQAVRKLQRRRNAV